MVDAVSKEKYELLINAFVDVETMSHEAFINKSFHTVFSLIEEAEKASYYELQEDQFVPVLSIGYDFNILSRLAFSIDDAFIDFQSTDDQSIDAYEVHIIKRDEHSFSKNTIDAFKALGTYENFRSLYAPVKLGTKKIGLLCFENFSNMAFSENSKTLLKLFAQQYSNIYTLRHYRKESEKKLDSIVKVLVKTIELKDFYTMGHANRVQDISKKLANCLQLNPDQMYTLSIAALLHDVGKIGIPTDILTKPGKLNKEEFDLIKTHPENAKMILDEIDGFEAVSLYAYCHHERYNGTGYPQGLAGEEIPIEAQIIQIADAFDAMTSDRSYRNAFTKNEAISIITAQRGLQFHPNLVDLMIQLFPDL